MSDDKTPPNPIVPPAVQNAANQGKSLALMATEAVDGDVNFNEIMAGLSQDKNELGQVDEAPRSVRNERGEPTIGRMDVVLYDLMKEQKDRRGLTYRKFDHIEADDEKRYIVALIDRRHKSGDRRLTPRDVQRVREICEGVGILWTAAHLKVGGA